MTAGRALMTIGIGALLAAALLALVSRAPESIRSATAPASASDPALADRFTDAQVARHGTYRRAGYVAAGLGLLLNIGALIVLARGPVARAVDQLGSVWGGWPVQTLVLGAAVALVLAVSTLPLGYVHGFAIDKAWGLSTQTPAGWLADWARGAGVAAAVGGVAALAFFAVVRWQPRLWWLWGWAAFTALSALLAFLWPVVIAPLFFDFSPLRDESLGPRLERLTQAAGVDVDEILVADASRRTTSENAYVAGLGASKQLVVYDTLLRGPEEETAFVVAHELGHEKESHVLKNIALASAGLFVGFAVLTLVARREGLWEWAGAAGVRDLKAIPLLILFVTLASVVALPVQNYASRRFERRADAIALDLTQDPATAVRVFRRLAFSNIADLRPPEPVVGLLFSHPPIPDRIRSALARSTVAP